MSDEPKLATAEELMATAKGKRRFKGGDDDPGGPLVLPVCGLRVRIRSLTAREVSEYQAVSLSRRGRQGEFNRARLLDADRRLITLCLVDKDGNRLLSDGQVGPMAEWDGADTQYLYDECAAHCGISREDIEVLEKNSARIHADDSPSE